MIGRNIVVAALLLPAVIANLPNNLKKHSKLLAELKANGYIKNGKLDIPVAEYCRRNALKMPAEVVHCASLTELARVAHHMESDLFCTRNDCDAKYDPLEDRCQCNWGSVREMDEDFVWPDKNCRTTTTCYTPLEPHWNSTAESCTCSIATFPKTTSLPVFFSPDPVREKLYGPSNKNVNTGTVDDMLQNVEDRIKNLATAYKDAAMSLAQRGGDSDLPGLETLKKMYQVLTAIKAKSIVQKRELDAFVARQAAPGTIAPIPIPTYIPPPNTEVTQELIQESLLLQPQKVATVGSVIPHFSEGTISFLVQLDGPISQTLSLNATDTLPCENIGAQPQPNLILVPKSVKNGTPQIVVPTCLVIAVNMYSPQYITYWIQKEDGSVFSLLSDNKIRAIDQLDTSQPASIAIQVASVNSGRKRNDVAGSDVRPLKRRQIFSIACDNPCPFHHMDRVNGSDGYCGCMFKGANQNLDLTVRGVEEPTRYTATMTAAACAAMTCINNGGKSALFNPFTATCWCASPSYVETNENAYDGGM